MGMFQGALFDLDDTLVPTGGINTSVYVRLFRENYGLDYIKLAREFSGFLSLYEFLDRVNEVYGIEIDNQRFSNRASKMQLELLRESSPDVTPVRNLLDRLRERGTKTAITTASPLDRAEEILEIVRLENYFDQIVADEHVKNKKPAADVFHVGAERLGVDYQNCVVFEDTPIVISSARDAGFIVAGCEVHKRFIGPVDADLVYDSYHPRLEYQIGEFFR